MKSSTKRMLNGFDQVSQIKNERIAMLNQIKRNNIVINKSEEIETVDAEISEGDK